MGLDTSYINIRKSLALWTNQNSLFCFGGRETIGLSSLVAIAPAIRHNRTAVARAIAAIAATML